MVFQQNNKLWKLRNPNNLNLIIGQFQKGHKINVGRKHSIQSKLKQSISTLGNKNPNWNENSTSIHTGHNRAYRWFSKNKINCEICNSQKFIEIHHIDKNPLNNSIKNIQFVCRKCHMTIDNRIINNLQHKGVNKNLTSMPVMF
jgi:mRNA-degrading endonuclease YafQ of YafQ-DinJ toxin-antitoxin module